MTRVVLLNPGPVMTADEVREALAGPDLCHREADFGGLLARVRHELTDLCGGTGTHDTVVLTSSGTGAVEAAVASAVPADGVVLTLENGHYGERMRQIAQSHGIPVRRFEVPWGRPLDAHGVAARLAAEPQVTHVTLVHHETSTAMLNDLPGIARVVADAGRSLIVDAVSSVGCEDVDVAAQGVDWLAGTSNKCLEGMPGLSFVTARADLLDALDGRPARGYTVDLGRHHRAQARAGVPAFTPAVPTFYALEVALRRLRAETVAGRRARYGRLADLLRAGLVERGFTVHLDPAERASSLTSLDLPPGLTYAELHAGLRARGYVVYASQEHLRDHAFRVATMGTLTEDEVRGFLAALDEVVAATPRTGPRHERERRHTGPSHAVAPVAT